MKNKKIKLISNAFFVILGNYPAVFINFIFLYWAKKINFFIFDIIYIFIVTILFYWLFIVRLLSLNWEFEPIANWYNSEIKNV